MVGNGVYFSGSIGTGHFNTHRPPSNHNAAAYIPNSLEERVSIKWEPLTQIGDVSERVLIKVQNNVNLYKAVITEEGDHSELINEMKQDLDRIFANIRLKLGEGFGNSYFGILHEQYNIIKKPDVKQEPQQEYRGIGAIVIGNPVTVKIQNGKTN